MKTISKEVAGIMSLSKTQKAELKALADSFSDALAATTDHFKNQEAKPTIRHSKK